MAALPNATFIGFTGTPVDKTAHGKGTFKTFGCEDDKGYLHKYSIADSIVHELLHFSAPNHGKLWKMLMRTHLGDYEQLEQRLKNPIP